MEEIKPKSSFRAEYDDTIHHITIFYNMLTNADKYDNRIFYLTMTSSETLDYLAFLFPIHKQEIRDVILEKMAQYFSSFKELAGCNFVFNENSEGYEMRAEDERGKVLVYINLYDRTVTLDAPENIKQIELYDIPKIDTQIDALLTSIEAARNSLNEDQITEVKDYAKKMFMPKRYEKQVDAEIRGYQMDLDFQQDKKRKLQQELEVYHRTPEYKNRKRVGDILTSIMRVKGAE